MRALSLMKHQAEAVDWLCARKRGLLYYPPGAGKTVITLETLRRLACRRVLIVAPVSLLSVWVDELAKFYGEGATLIRGDKKRRAVQLADVTHRYHVIGYETLRVDADAVGRVAWDAVVLDETYKIQNPVAKVTKRILKLGAPVKIALNGTLISNNLGDVWSVCEWLERGVLYGNWYAFRGAHAVMNPYIPGAIMGWRNVENVEKKVAHLISRKTKAEVLAHLPPLTEQVVSFELSPAERRIYEKVKAESLVVINDETVPIGNALVELLRLRQVTNGLFAFGMEEPSSKINVLKELLATISVEDKVVIFSSFKTTVVKLCEELPGSLCISGDVSVEERERILWEFSTNPERRILVMTSAGERGLNIQAANYTVLMDNAWSNAAHEQRVGRTHRTGQTKPVYIYSLEARGTVDEKIHKILEKKKELADSFGSITKADLVELLEDSPF